MKVFRFGPNDEPHFKIPSSELRKKIVELDQKYFSYSWSDEGWYKTWLGNKDQFLVVSDHQSELFGFSIFDLDYFEKLAHLQKILVHPTMRKEGLGRANLQKSLDTLRRLGFERVILEVEKGNWPAIKLYEALNFKEIYYKKKFYSNGSDAHIMECHL